jgi:phosphatidate phosphatase PAH1
MPTSVNQLEDKFQLKYLKSFKWGTSFIENKNGIYIISTSKDKDFLPVYENQIVFNETQINLWMANAPNIQMNGKKPSKLDLIKHLNGFWLPDETILYIGKAEKQTLSERICQFYNHKVGKKSPHKGGYWLKLLQNLNELYVHVYSTKESHVIEQEMLKLFIANVSESTKSNLIDKDLCLPFANLQLRSRVIKSHGLKNHCQ